MFQKFLLCRPQGGLNDILCQIEKCCQYAEKTKRIVIVDTNYINSDFFRDNFKLYFSSRQKNLILSPKDYLNDIHQLTVYPSILQNRLDSYVSRFDSTKKLFIDTISGHATTFDFNVNYPHPLLVHHQSGGGTLSQFALLRLTLNKFLADELFARINKIGGSWLGVHVRNTDYTTDYDLLLAQLKQKSVKRIFLATDSLLVKHRFQIELNDSKIYSFSRRLSVNQKPLHNVHNIDNSEIFLSNCDAILDLIILALSSKLVFEKINSNPYGATNSGYALLAQNLWNSKIILKFLISDQRINFGLE